MNLLKPLQWRYATKRFDPTQKIDPKTLETLLDALALTPSSYGLQPWKFLVITDPDTRAKLRPHSWNQSQITDSSHLIVLCRMEEMTEAHVDHYLENIINVRGGTKEDLAGYRELMIGNVVKGKSESEKKEWMKNQVYIALGNLMTSAAILEVDTCPIEGFDAAKYDEILDLPSQGLRACVVCPVGYRSDEDDYAKLEKVRFPKEEIVVRK